MIELANNEYGKLQSLLAGLNYHLAVHAILSGQTTAAVFVDDPASPQLALLWHKSRCYLAGKPNLPTIQAILQPLFADVIGPRALALGAEVLVFYYDPGTWQAHLPELLPNKRVMVAPRQYYTLAACRFDWRSLLPAGYTLHLVDATLVYDTTWRNRDRLSEEMCSERSSLDDFLAHSFGVCLTHGDEIAGWCLSEYNLADRCEVGIETLAAHQRRGLATVMTLALCEQAFGRGMTQVGWDCWTRNVASGATARKAGFTLACDYSAGLAWLHEDA